MFYSLESFAVWNFQNRIITNWQNDGITYFGMDRDLSVRWFDRKLFSVYFIDSLYKLKEIISN